MSFKTIARAPARLNRSELSVPGSSPKFFEKAAKSEADVVFLDLEDSVAPDKKAEARKNVIQAIGDVDWGEKTLSVRINGLDTPYMYRDVIDLLENCSERLDLIMIPKVGTAGDVYATDMLVSQIERAKGRRKRIGFEMIIETALGMQNIGEIAAASPRNESLHFGVADYAASVRARTVVSGGMHAVYPGDPWHYALCRMRDACRAYGLRPIDGPFGDIKDPDGYRAAGKRGAALGIEGKWAIHPSQIALANEIFSPPPPEVDRAKRILVALDEAAKAGRGAAQLDGRMIDAASARMAENVVRMAEAIAAR